MTLAKAHKLVNLMLENKEKKKDDMLDRNQPWNQDNDNMMKNIVLMVVEGFDNDIEWLNSIKKQLPPTSNCNHPKEMRDRCDGQLYCMNCNEDLN